MTSRPRVAVLDYRMNNLLSVAKALELLGAKVVIARDPVQVDDVDGVVLPGVGHFGTAMGLLTEQGLDNAARAVAADGRPLLGICLGMQLLLDESEEAPGAVGLGLVPGRVRRLATSRKVPQIAWNPVEWSVNSTLGSLDAPEQRTYYFVHSFAAHPSDPGHVAGRADYGGPFVAAIEKDNVAGVQFHPEKSSRAGLALLGRWLSGVPVRSAR